MEGTPFRHQGRLPGPQGGTDCGGLIELACAATGHPYVGITAYRRRPTAEQVRTALEGTFDRVPLPPAGVAPVVGDILFFDIRRDGMPCHLGVMQPGEQFTHAHADPRVRSVVRAILCPHWRGLLSEVYRTRS
ncbi:hypothetical protein WDZ11_00080 (plasmid) [Roseomonas mucosa]|uniref:hypothetical protein n=1 Tax=Roseomonas mucosa TaxID=207340 RepID=UPI0030D0E116